MSPTIELTCDARGRLYDVPNMVDAPGLVRLVLPIRFALNLDVGRHKVCLLEITDNRELIFRTV